MGRSTGPPCGGPGAQGRQLPPKGQRQGRAAARRDFVSLQFSTGVIRPGFNRLTDESTTRLTSSGNIRATIRFMALPRRTFARRSFSMGRPVGRAHPAFDVRFVRLLARPLLDRSSEAVSPTKGANRSSVLSSRRCQPEWAVQNFRRAPRLPEPGRSAGCRTPTGADALDAVKRLVQG